MPSVMQQRGRDNRAAADQHRSQTELPGKGSPAGEDGPGESTIHHNEDGTHSVTHSDGSESGPHEHLHGAMAEIGSRQMGGLHHMTHDDGMGGGLKTHQAQHGEAAEGPHDHENLESVKSGMDKFFNEEENEGHQGHKDGEQAGEDEY